MVQFFPGDDATGAVVETFSDGTDAYGRSPSLYVRAVPWANFFHDERGGGSPFIIKHNVGFIHDAIAPRAVSSPDTSASYRPSAMYAARGVEREDVRVSMEADLYRDSGTIGGQVANSGFYGVFARLHGGVITNADTRTEYLGDLTTQDATNSLKGYAFYVSVREGQGVRYAIVKLRTDDADGPEVLAQRTDADFSPYDAFDSTNGRYGPTGIRLECTTVAGDAVLTAYLRDFKNGGAWTQITTATDLAASSPFLVPGRCGFSLPQIGNNGKPFGNFEYAVCGAVASAFEIVDIAGADVLYFRDEFSRRNREQARSWGTGTAGASGLGGANDEPTWTTLRDPHYALANQYHGDLVSTDDTGAVFWDILRSDGADRSEAGGIDPPRTPGPMVSCQTYDPNQHVKADFNITDEATKRAAVGFVLRYTDRVSPPDYSSGSGIRGYEVRVTFIPPTTFTAEVYGNEGGAAPVLLADATLGGLTHNVEFEIDAEVQNVAGTGGSRVAVGVKIDAAFVAFAAQAAGVSIIGDYVVDDRAAAIADGVGRALLYDSPAGSPRPLATYDNLTALTLSTISIGGGSEEDENTDLLASVVIAGETDGSTGVLALEQTWPEREDSAYRQGRQALRSGQSVVRARDRRGRRVWGLEAAQMETAERVRLADFIDAREGPTVPFGWTTGDGESIVASFSKVPDLSLRQDLPFTESAVIEITERFGPNFETVEANWEPINQAIIDANPITPPYFSQHIRADGIVLAQASVGQGGESPDTTREFKVVFPSANGVGSFDLVLGGTAVDGTHYTITPTTFEVAAGDTVKTTTVTVLEPGLYFTEKSLTLSISGSVGITAGDDAELHLFFYATPGATVGDPPALDFTTGTASTSPDPNAFQTKFAVVDQHRSDDMGSRVSGEITKVYVRAIASGGLVEGDDYTVNLEGLIPRLIGTSTSDSDGVSPSAVIRPYAALDPIIGETIDFYIDHEPEDASEENFWNYADDWRHEFGNGTLAFNLQPATSYPGEPSPHANGGGNNTNKDPRFGTDIVTQGQAGVTGDPIETPWGVDAQVILQSQAISSDWYNRESFEASEYAGTLERKQTLATYVLFWTYIDRIEGSGDWRNCRFFVLNVRNRAPGNLEIGAHFQRVAPGSATTDVDKDWANVTSVIYNGGTAQTTVETDAGVFGLWKRERLHPDSKVGVDEETDANGQTHTRLWCLAKVDGTYTVETNDLANVTYQGEATGGSSGTTLEDTAVSFNNYQIKIGSLIRNVTAGFSSDVTAVSGSTLTTRTGTWTSGDVYRVSQKDTSAFSSGSATASSTSTILNDTTRNFEKLSVSIGDLVFNDTDGSTGVVTIVGATQLTITALAGGLNNTFATGDKYLLYVNGNGRATTDDPTGDVLEDTNASFIVDRVGRFDEITNTTTGAVGEIDFIDSDTQITLTSGGLVGGSRQDWDVNDNYTIAHRAVKPDVGWQANAIYRYGFFNGGDSRNGQTSSADRAGKVAGVRGTGAIAWGPGYVTDSTEANLLLAPGTDDRPCPITGPPDPDVTTPKNDGPGRHWPKDGFWREPRGNATKLSPGVLKWTLTIG